MEWTIREIIDQDVEFQSRYDLVSIETGAAVSTFEIVPVRALGDIEGTKVDKAWLEPIERALKEVEGDLRALGLRITNTSASLASSENAVNVRINASNARIDVVESKLPTLAPLLNPVLTNPTANHVSVSSNNTSLMTTQEGKKYFDGLMAAYRG